MGVEVMDLTNLGDLVVRKSYGGDVTFRIEKIERNVAIIKGIDFRLLADAPLTDLVKVDPDSLAKERDVRISRLQNRWSGYIENESSKHSEIRLY